MTIKFDGFDVKVGDWVAVKTSNETRLCSKFLEVVEVTGDHVITAGRGAYHHRLSIAFVCETADEVEKLTGVLADAELMVYSFKQALSERIVAHVKELGNGHD